jgi:hypothetical protein
MSDHCLIKQFIIAESGICRYRWVVTNVYEGDEDGLLIEYQEKLDKQWITKESLGFYEETADLLMQALDQIRKIY